MFASTAKTTHAASASADERRRLSSFYDGSATLDLLLAELNPHDTRLIDAVLDLRLLCVAGTDARACVTQLFIVRELLGIRHYHAFYQVRCWARGSLRIEVRADRISPWIGYELPLSSTGVDETIDNAIAALLPATGHPGAAHARFVFTRHQPPPVIWWEEPRILEQTRGGSIR